MEKVYLILAFLSITVSFTAHSQDKKIVIKGTVISASREEPVASANIFIPAISLGTITGNDGKFTLEVPAENKRDTIIFSLLGYKPYITVISQLTVKSGALIELEDSLFLLNEIKAICFDNIDALKWKNKNDNKSRTMLSFATRKVDNVSNYINLLKETHGYTKLKGNSLKWKKVEIPGFKFKVEYHLSFFPCPYCPEEENVTVTIEVKDNKGKNLAESPEHKKEIIRHFQNMLDKTFAQGIDYSQLEKRLDVMYLKKSTEPFTGKCYGYFENGQKGLRGELKNGVRDGYWEFWYSNGQKKVEGSYVDGMKNGEWTYWYSDGVIRMKANYVMDAMDGMNYWYFENGNKKKEALFRDGVYLQKTEWDQNGKIIEATHYVH
jgi:antitoxin component YwqK of YwqJK toxin-antitoxin module